MFMSGKPLRSAYRVLARDGRVVWFQCEVKMVRGDDGRPWFIHGVGFDVTDLKTAEAALQGERNLLTAILDTVGAVVVVLAPDGAIIRFNRAGEMLSGYSFREAQGRFFWDLFPTPEEGERCRALLAELRPGQDPSEYEADWVARDGSRRRIAWSSTLLPGSRTTPSHIITTGIDVTERKRMEKALLEISAREQRQIGQDLHDGLGAAPHRHRVHEQGARPAAGGGARDAGGPGRQDRAPGERGDRQDPGAGARAGAGLLRRRGTGLGVAPVGRRGGGPVPRLLHGELPGAGPGSGRRHGHAPVSHRARGGQQRPQARRGHARSGSRWAARTAPAPSPSRTTAWASPRWRPAIRDSASTS